jgi:hypothetical protein
MSNNNQFFIKDPFNNDAQSHMHRLWRSRFTRRVSHAAHEHVPNVVRSPSVVHHTIRFPYHKSIMVRIRKSNCVTLRTVSI